MRMGPRYSIFTMKYLRERGGCAIIHGKEPICRTKTLISDENSVDDVELDIRLLADVDVVRSQCQIELAV